MPEAFARSRTVQLAHRLHRRRERERAGLFLAEGPDAVAAALAADWVTDVFYTADGLKRWFDLVDSAASGGAAPCLVTLAAMERACDAASPQPIAAICRLPRWSAGAVLDRLDDAAVAASRVAVLLVGCADPGNVGAVVRLVDAVAGAGVAVADGADPFGPKAVRASAGSVFRVPAAVGVDPEAFVADAVARGGRAFATVARCGDDLFDLSAGGTVGGPVVWVLGGESHGVPERLVGMCERAVTIPVFGGAESLNLATAAALCLYESARAGRPSPDGGASPTC